MKIQQLLVQKGASQADFAHAIDAKPTLISAAFHQNRDIPMKKILKIATYFGVSPFDIVIGNDTKDTDTNKSTPKTKRVS
ncbi:MAG: helix-turn-helix transcriptional regulator [Campylobacterales bacterium]|nr:helix-turn-helix transcriptional regulator [Campylobacterales bacterium]